MTSLKQFAAIVITATLTTLAISCKQSGKSEVDAITQSNAEGNATSALGILAVRHSISNDGRASDHWISELANLTKFALIECYATEEVSADQLMLELETLSSHNMLALNTEAQLIYSRPDQVGGIYQDLDRAVCQPLGRLMTWPLIEQTFLRVAELRSSSINIADDEAERIYRLGQAIYLAMRGPHLLEGRGILQSAKTSVGGSIDDLAEQIELGLGGRLMNAAVEWTGTRNNLVMDFLAEADKEFNPCVVKGSGSWLEQKFRKNGMYECKPMKSLPLANFELGKNYDAVKTTLVAQSVETHVELFSAVEPTAFDLAVNTFTANRPFSQLQHDGGLGRSLHAGSQLPAQFSNLSMPDILATALSRGEFSVPDSASSGARQTARFDRSRRTRSIAAPKFADAIPAVRGNAASVMQNYLGLVQEAYDYWQRTGDYRIYAQAQAMLAMFMDQNSSMASRPSAHNWQNPRVIYDGEGYFAKFSPEEVKSAYHNGHLSYSNYKAALSGSSQDIGWDVHQIEGVPVHELRTASKHLGTYQFPDTNQLVYRLRGPDGIDRYVAGDVDPAAAANGFVAPDRNLADAVYSTRRGIVNGVIDTSERFVDKANLPNSTESEQENGSPWQALFAASTLHAQARDHERKVSDAEALNQSAFDHIRYFDRKYDYETGRLQSNLEEVKSDLTDVEKKLQEQAWTSGVKILEDTSELAKKAAGDLWKRFNDGYNDSQ